MYQYLFVMRSCGCYGLPEYAIMNKKQVDDLANICVENDIDYIIIDLFKAFDPYGKDAIIISQSIVEKDVNN